MTDEERWQEALDAGYDWDRLGEINRAMKSLPYCQRMWKLIWDRAVEQGIVIPINTRRK